MTHDEDDLYAYSSMSVNHNRVAVDLAALARLVSRDRGDKSQKAYGRELGLTQAQISLLELGKIRRLSEDVADALRRRFKELPRVRDAGEQSGAAAGSKVAPATPVPAAPVVSAFNSVPDEIRDAVQELWQGQARLLANFAEAVWVRALERARDGAEEKPGRRKVR